MISALFLILCNEKQVPTVKALIPLRGVLKRVPF